MNHQAKQGQACISSVKWSGATKTVMRKYHYKYMNETAARLAGECTTKRSATGDTSRVNTTTTSSAPATKCNSEEYYQFECNNPTN